MTINEPNTNMCVYSASTWCEKAAAAHAACDLLRACGICLFMPSSGRVHTHFCVWLIYCHFTVIFNFKLVLKWGKEKRSSGGG